VGLVKRDVVGAGYIIYIYIYMPHGGYRVQGECLLGALVVVEEAGLVELALAAVVRPGQGSGFRVQGAGGL
jgi:hypothetical protein